MRFVEFIKLFEVQAVIRLFLSGVIGILIGNERAKKGRQIGARTHSIVAIASCLTVLASLYLHEYYPDIDAARIPAQVISGIGFLGAGTIIVTQQNKVQGLTTAAGLWACACLGIAAGTGFYVGTIAGAVIIFYVMHFLKVDSDHILENSKQADNGHHDSGGELSEKSENNKFEK